MLLSPKFEERVPKISFFAHDQLTAKLYCYIYITIFGKYRSELYWIVLMYF